MAIHPTAVVDPQAVIHETAEIGAYTVIEGKMTIGADTVVASHAHLSGPTVIGARNRIGSFTSTGAPPQDMHYKGEPTELIIGDDNLIREYASIHRGTAAGKGKTDDERAKAVNLASHWIKSIAEDHGRNELAAMAAVTEAASFSPSEASGAAALSSFNQGILGAERLDPPLIDDAGSRDIEELLDRLQAGIVLANGETFSLPGDAVVHYVDMTGIERFLVAISDPTIAYMLLSIGMLGILIELLHPGVVLPRVLGGVCLLLGVYSLGVLDGN